MVFLNQTDKNINPYIFCHFLYSTTNIIIFFIKHKINKQLHRNQQGLFIKINKNPFTVTNII